MRIPWWYGVAVSTIVWVVEVLALGNVPESSALDQLVSGPLALAALATWLAMPVCLYLDRRTFGDDIAWTPATWLWVLGSLVWFLNIIVGTTYCLRRHVAARGTAPSEHWRSIVGASVAVWIVLVALDVVVPEGAIPPAGIDALAALAVLAWTAMPIAVLLDAVRVRGYTDWDPNTRAYVLGAAIPLVNVLVGGVYLYRRREAFDGVDTTRVFSPQETDGEGDRGIGGSPWFPRAGYVFGAYLLLMVVVGAAAPSLSETGLEILALLAWMPFGPFFAGCVYKDAAWRRANDHAIGDNWWLYLSSALIQGAAFWYLIRRATKAGRIRRQTAAGTGE